MSLVLLLLRCRLLLLGYLLGHNSDLNFNKSVSVVLIYNYK